MGHIQQGTIFMESQFDTFHAVTHIMALNTFLGQDFGYYQTAL